MTHDNDGMPEGAAACMAFFKSLPELFAHFRGVYERHPKLGEELWPLAGDEEELSEILPRGQTAGPWDLPPGAIEYRFHYRQIMNDFGNNHPELRHEIEEAERIIARNTKSVSLHAGSPEKRNDGKVTLSFTLARGPLSPEEQEKFIRDLAAIVGASPDEIKFIGQHEDASAPDCKDSSIRLEP